MAISKQQSMRPAEIELIDATNQHAKSLETLDKSLTAETTARDSADTALGTRIDALRDSVAHVYQPSRPDKEDLLDIDPNDRNSPKNQPHVVRAKDVSTLSHVPPGITSGQLYGLWDCYVLGVYADNHAQILVTFREMHPVSGRVWMNWYNFKQWDGWKSLTPQ